MTVAQCGEYLQSFVNIRREQTKERAILLDGLSRQVVSGVGSLLDKKNKFITVDKLYPSLFNEKPEQSKRISNEELWKMIQEAKGVG